MAPLSPQLPSEVWVHVFGYLSTADKANVRTCCKYFKKLVDHGSLWKDCTVVLRFKNGAYNPQFWATLRRRKIQSVHLVQSVKAKAWEQLAMSLPTLTTIALDNVSKESLNFFKKFPNLKRLAIRGKHSSVMMNVTSIMSKPQQLTHLSLCDVYFLDTTKAAFIAAISQLTNLTSLVFHPDGKNNVPVKTFHSAIACLPKLKHLSWLMPPAHLTVSQGGGKGLQLDGVALSSLELIDYVDPALSKDTMRSLPGLQSLAVFYKHSHAGEDSASELNMCHLKTWLSDLNRLSALIIVKGPPLHMYADSIPATVTSLTLCMEHRPEDVAVVARRVPGLLHLHLDLWPWYAGWGNAQIPQLFPQLRSLKIRHQGVPENDFLNIQWLLNLERLELLDAHPGPSPHLSELICKLHALTNHRIQVITSPRQRDPLACSCTYRVY